MSSEADHLASLVERLKARATKFGSDEPLEVMSIKGSELLFLASQLSAVAAERDALRENAGKLHDYANMRDVQIVTAVEALDKIVDMNVQYAIDRYGDASKADDMACVTTARNALLTLSRRVQWTGVN